MCLPHSGLLLPPHRGASRRKCFHAISTFQAIHWSQRNSPYPFCRQSAQLFVLITNSGIFLTSASEPHLQSHFHLFILTVSLSFALCIAVRSISNFQFFPRGQKLVQESWRCSSCLYSRPGVMRVVLLLSRHNW